MASRGVSDGKVECRRGALVGHRLVLEKDRARYPPLALEVVEEAAQGHASMHLAVGDGRAEAAPPHEQALVDHLLDGPSHGGSRERKTLCESHFVLERVARLQAPVVDAAHSCSESW